MKTPLIEFKNVSQNFNGKNVLQDVNLTINQHQILGLVGRSGSGKTTLFRLFLRIYKPSKGKIYFNGKKVNDKIKQKVGFASQENSFYPRLTVEENLRYFGCMYNLPKKLLRTRIDRLLELMQLENSRKVWAKNLSGGMKRRLDLAIALVHDPDVLILDEPTTGLDIILNENIWQLILKIKEHGKTIIVSSHNLEEIEKHCTEIAFVSHGQVVEWEKLKKLKKKYGLKNLFRRICNDQSL